MAIDPPTDASIQIEPFDPATHDRTAFSCGVASIDNFLKLTAKKNQADDYSRVWIAVRPGQKRILGYYSLNSHSIAAGTLPETVAKRAPHGRDLPAVYISMFGVDRSVQGGGIGKLLFADCLRCVARASTYIGIFAAVLDVLDDGDIKAIEGRMRFYAFYGFAAFPSQPLKLFLPLRNIRLALGLET